MKRKSAKARNGNGSWGRNAMVTVSTVNLAMIMSRDITMDGTTDGTMDMTPLSKKGDE